MENNDISLCGGWVNGGDGERGAEVSVKPDGGGYVVEKTVDIFVKKRNERQNQLYVIVVVTAQATCMHARLTIVKSGWLPPAYKYLITIPFR